MSAQGITAIFSNRITDLTLRFLLVLNDKGRLAYVDRIATAFDQMVQASFGRIEVDIFTPSTLGAEQLEGIKQRIQAALHKEPVIYAYSDPSMLGGIKLRIGDQLIDASVATQLRQMREKLGSSGHTALRERFDRLTDEGGQP